MFLHRSGEAQGKWITVFAAACQKMLLRRRDGIARSDGAHGYVSPGQLLRNALNMFLVDIQAVDPS